MIDADKVAGPLGAMPDHAPRHRGLSEGVHEPRFHQVQKAEPERAVDIGKLALPDWRGCCSVCVFRAKPATDSGMKSATDSDLISAIPI
jgi:hypothetical protein